MSHPTPSRLRADLAAVVRFYRTHAELSQDALAEEMQGLGFSKWSQATVWSVERGDRPLRVEEAASMAGLFGTTLGCMAEGVDAFADVTFLAGFRSGLASAREALDCITPPTTTTPED